MSQKPFSDMEQLLDYYECHMKEFGLVPRLDLFEEVRALSRILSGMYGPAEDYRKNDFERAVHDLLANIHTQLGQKMVAMQLVKDSLPDLIALKYKVIHASTKVVRQGTKK